jgi:mono/diheme cytochrome c family protein
MRLIGIAGVPLVLSLLGAAVLTMAFAPSRDVLARQGQIESGAAVFLASCARCHGAAAEGGRGPALDAPTLGGYRTADRLFRYISLSMPEDDPGSLAEQEYYDVIAFLLDLNGSNPDGIPVDPSTAPDISLSS